MLTASAKLMESIEPVVNGMGYELWGCEYQSRRRQALVRVYIDAADGITLDDCARVSHQLSGVLDVEDPIGMPYALEVSSPGLDRPLLKVEHFERYTGQRVKIRLKRLLDGRRNFDARVLAVDAEHVVIDDQRSQYAIPFEAIKQARLVPEI